MATANTGFDPAIETPFLAELRAAAPALRASAPAWVEGLRHAAIARYAALGFPQARTEAWKYTNLNALKAVGFVPADRAAGAALARVPAGAAALDAPRIAMVNGRLDAGLSDLARLPDGVVVQPLSEAMARADQAVIEALRDGAVFERQPLAALATAFLADGVVIRIAPGAKVEVPLHLVSVGAPGGDAAMFAPRVVVIVGDGSAATLVESHVGLGIVPYFANVVTQVRLGAGATFGHYNLQDQAPDAFHIALTDVQAEDGSSYDGFALQVGGRLARNEVRARLGQHVEFRINGVYMAAGSQHIDNTTFIEHAAPNSRSQEIFKGVLDGRARGVFQGKILVRPDAQKTDGYQMNRALLLSREAEIDSKPELEIYADDVKCSHGATVGELDGDQLFYLMARGIDRDTARRMLVEAYVAEAVDEIRSEPVRAAFAAIASGWLSARDAT